MQEITKDNVYDFSNYNQMLESFEYEILLKIDDDDWQGDSRVIFKDSRKYGWLQFGWGSCSGCDELEGCGHNIEALQQLQKTLFNSIKWFDSLENAIEFFDNHDWQGDYSWHRKEQQDFIRLSKLVLRNELVPHLAGVI